MLSRPTQRPNGFRPSRDFRGYPGGRFLGLHLVIYGVVPMITVPYFPKGLIAPVTALANRQGGEHLEALSAQDAIAAAAE